VTGLATVLFVQCIAGVAVAWLSGVIHVCGDLFYLPVLQRSDGSNLDDSNGRVERLQNGNMRILVWSRKRQSHDELMRMARLADMTSSVLPVDFYLASERAPVRRPAKTECFVITSAHADEQSALVVLVVIRVLLDRMQHGNWRNCWCWCGCAV
jgi:hypothetical protein